MLNVVIIIVALGLTAYLAFSPRLAQSSRWKAMVTPLASIMGSGFLVSAPLLAHSVGNFALACMAALLVLAFFVGDAVRFNIRHFEPVENHRVGAAQATAFLSRIVLAGAYFISVTYYLQLLASFIAPSLGLTSGVSMNLITTALLVAIGGIGMWKGLDMLEGVEKYAIALNLGMIGALLVALIYYNGQLAVGGEWALADVSSEINFQDVRILLGMLIVVQGFETSRYLGSNHSAAERIQTMRWAQLLSGGIYLIFIGLVTVLFHDGFGSDVTAIVKMTQPVAIVLPVLISIAAVGSQFSAAVADNEGAGGLLEDITKKRLPMCYAYLFILLVTLVLTWETNVNEIIAYASRAFALYYALQCAVALFMAIRIKDLPNRKMRLVQFAVLSLICMLVFALGLPAE